ncbi:Mor transcription activator family protein [Marinobacter sp. X15-166B]|uniref:Mor transcription activator family protein n=1 Tax=Marinobacter sp. X15-166B TaxID=1897620 RepID=UPI00085C3643|nr:Mor transcription activator family protein [Marinobacter sp. X15-166B]OEY66809.1 hypothetical protein BG841_10315 [Marinobacter sp. X15-166B]
MISDLNRDTDTAVELHRILTAAIIRGFSLTESAAAALADQLAAEVRREAGGGHVYIPGPNLSVRNRAIRAAFRGNNLDELARKYSLSRRQVERIVQNNDTAPVKMSVGAR